MAKQCDDSISVAILSFQDNTDIIGAKYVHAYLRANGIASHLVLIPDYTPAMSDEILSFLRERNVCVVGISLMTPEAPRAFSFAQTLKSAMPETTLIFGGIHATIDYADCLNWGDAAVRGEGERIFLEVVKYVAQGKALAGLPGVCVKQNGRSSPPPPPMPLVEDLNTLPFPGHLPPEMYVIHHGKARKMDRVLFEQYSRYAGRFLNIMTTRGCPFACTYCCNSAYRELYPHWTVRYRTVENVIAELLVEKLAFPGILTVNIHDDCFLSNDIEWLAEFAAEYRAKIGIPFVVRTTPVHVRREALNLLKDAGLIWIMMGLQTGSDRVNREIYHRPVNRKLFLNAANAVRDVGLAAVYDVILDNPYETDADLLDTLDTVLSIPKPFQFQIMSLRLFKGTQLQRRAEADGIRAEDPRLNYFAFTPTPLNRIIKMAPIYPRWLIRRIAVYRQTIFGKAAIRVLTILGDWLLTPLSYIILTHKAYGSRLKVTVSMLVFLSRTFVRQRITAPLSERNRDSKKRQNDRRVADPDMRQHLG